MITCSPFIGFVVFKDLDAFYVHRYLGRSEHVERTRRSICGEIPGMHPGGALFQSSSRACCLLQWESKSSKRRRKRPRLALLRRNRQPEGISTSCYGSWRGILSGVFGARNKYNFIQNFCYFYGIFPPKS